MSNKVYSNKEVFEATVDEIVRNKNVFFTEEEIEQVRELDANLASMLVDVQESWEDVREYVISRTEPRK